MMRAAQRLSVCVAAVAVLLMSASCGDKERRSKPSMKKGLIVLGVDGMDPKLLREYMAKGLMPNLKRLGEQGSFIELDTTNPPQSPVAWSTFLTGLGADVHGIYDFVHRDPVHMSPYLSTSKTSAGDPSCIGDFAFSLDGGVVELLRAGRAFWQDLEDRNVPATVVKVPANFPPAGSKVNESMAGMGTPDLLGTYGTFNLYSDELEMVGKSMSAGVIHEVDFAGGQRVMSELAGPPSPTSCSAKEMTLPVEIIRDQVEKSAIIRIGDQEVLLAAGEWSEWTPVEFDAGLVGGSIGGMVRLYLRDVRPFRLYVSPINLDPTAPAMPISSPESYAAEVAADIGRYYTQGMPEDTKALSGGALSAEEFLGQEEIIWKERVALLEREKARYDGGVLFFYFSSVDQLSHVFFRSLLPDAPADERQWAHVIPDAYAKVDKKIGEVLDWAPEGTEVIVMSDHGFSQYKRKVHLNSWLAQNGYLALRSDGNGEGPLGHIDWENTQAYALGLNQLFINLEGREAHGIVSPDEKEVLMMRLSRELEAWRDSDTGMRVVTSMEAPDPGAFPDRAPDLLVGYNQGYRSSDESAMGMVGNETIEDNTGQWSGDHCMDPVHVPGVLLSTKAVNLDRAHLRDLTPTILGYFGLTATEPVPGVNLWANTTTALIR